MGSASENQSIANRLSTAGYVSVFILFVLIYIYLLVPNYDDGINAYHIRNTIGFSRPFYNDYFGKNFPVQKLSTITFAVIFTYFLPFSFKPLGFVYATLIFASTCLVYEISKNYTTHERSFLASSLFLFYILIHDWLTPTRPELWLLTTILLVVLLCEWFLSKSHLSYLISASIVTGVVGLPIHTNASILYLYFSLFLWSYRHLLSRRSLLVVLLALTVSAGIGLGIILYPNPDSTVRFFADISSDGKRFSFLIGEINRLSYFGRYTFWRYLTTFFVVVCAVRLLKVKPSWKLLRDVYISFRNPVLYTLSVFIGLGLLPSAEWFSYVVYYLLPVVVLFSIQYTEFEPGKLGKRIFLLSVGAILIVLFIYARLGRLRSGGYEAVVRYEALEFIFLVLPVFVLSMLRAKGKSHMIYLVLILGMMFKLFLMYSNHSIYSTIAQHVKNHLDSTVLGHASFSWATENDRFVAITNRTNLEVDHGTAIIGHDDQSRFEELMQQRACQHEEVHRMSDTFNNPFILPPYRDVRYYEFWCVEN